MRSALKNTTTFLAMLEPHEIPDHQKLYLDGYLFSREELLNYVVENPHLVFTNPYLMDATEGSAEFSDAAKAELMAHPDFKPHAERLLLQMQFQSSGVSTATLDAIVTLLRSHAEYEEARKNHLPIGEAVLARNQAALADFAAYVLSLPEAERIKLNKYVIKVPTRFGAGVGGNQNFLFEAVMQQTCIVIQQACLWQILVDFRPATLATMPDYVKRQLAGHSFAIAVREATAAPLLPAAVAPHSIGIVNFMFNERSQSLEIFENETVGAVNRRLAAALGLMDKKLRLICHGVSLEEDSLISIHNLTAETLVRAIEERTRPAATARARAGAGAGASTAAVATVTVPAAPVSAPISGPVSVEQESMITIKFLKSSRSVSISIGLNRTVRELMLTIEAETGLSISKLLMRGTILDLDSTIKETGMLGESLVSAMEGPRPAVSVMPATRAGVRASTLDTVTASAAELSLTSPMTSVRPSVTTAFAPSAAKFDSFRDPARFAEVEAQVHRFLSGGIDLEAFRTFLVGNEALDTIQPYQVTNAAGENFAHHMLKIGAALSIERKMSFLIKFEAIFRLMDSGVILLPTDTGMTPLKMLALNFVDCGENMVTLFASCCRGLLASDGGCSKFVSYFHELQTGLSAPAITAITQALCRVCFDFNVKMIQAPLIQLFAQLVANPWFSATSRIPMTGIDESNSPARILDESALMFCYRTLQMLGKKTLNPDRPALEALFILEALLNKLARYTSAETKEQFRALMITVNPAYISLNLFSHGLRERAQKLVEDNYLIAMDHGRFAAAGAPGGRF